MAGVLVLILLVLPFIEVAVFVGVAGQVGLLPSVAGILVLGVVGAWLIRHEGLGVWRRAEQRLRAGEVPAAEVVNGLLLLAAGAALVLPGFVSDLLAIALLVPPVRAAVRALLLGRFERRVEATLAGSTDLLGGRGRVRIHTGPAVYDTHEVVGDPRHAAGRPDAP